MPVPGFTEFERHGRRMSARRIIVGVTWGAFAVILIVGGFLELTVNLVAGAVLCFVLGAGCAWYDYRVWIFKAKRLWFIA